MELPNVGTQCSFEECKQLDFLPVKCEFCTQIFCKDHCGTDLHCCPKVEVANVKVKSVSSNECAIHPFTEAMLQRELAFQKESLTEEQLKIIESRKKSKENFQQTKSTLDKDIDQKLKSSKNTTVANKVRYVFDKYKTYF